MFSQPFAVQAALLIAEWLQEASTPYALPEAAPIATYDAVVTL